MSILRYTGEEGELELEINTMRRQHSGSLAMHIRARIDMMIENQTGVNVRSKKRFGCVADEDGWRVAYISKNRYVAISHGCISDNAKKVQKVGRHTTKRGEGEK